jgi:HNH endonuclease
MIKIRLPHGHTALIDDDDEWVLEYTWCASRMSTNRVLYYAQAWVDSAHTYMHRLIMDAPPHLEVDHKNGNGLDNQRKNMRLVTHQQNSFNRNALNKNNVSGFQGVHWHTKEQKWRARITIDGKKIELGEFRSYNAAVQARKRAEIKYYGKYRPTFDT